jgi:broad specificity phosphatase PhoE
MGKALQEALISMRTIYVIRHGQTILNKQKKIRSWLNIPLDEAGVIEARKLGWSLHQDNHQINGLFSSQLLRSEQTAIEISKMSGIPILGRTEALCSWNVGSYAGENDADVHHLMMLWAKQQPDAVMGGGESFNIFKYRVLVGIIGLMNTQQNDVLGLVMHRGSEQLLRAWIAGGSCENLSVDFDVLAKRGDATASASRLQINCSLIKEQESNLFTRWKEYLQKRDGEEMPPISVLERHPMGNGI